MANKRRYARECALQQLYLLEIGRPVDSGRALARYWRHDWQVENDCHLCPEDDCADRDHPKNRFSLDLSGRADQEYSRKLVGGVLERRAQIDAEIEKHSLNWKLSRMSFIDRNILRIAIYEMLFLAEIPPKVSINEAIEIAKIYGDRNSPAFVNGILDQVGK